ncbi:MAG: right-handed parallel beta-helix repeat-containing protein [Verrucomicrobiae bacterium]|nr:right-handed parallel beta-helix repeat-containing protein [Verrucomicrobiae bacterium]
MKICLLILAVAFSGSYALGAGIIIRVPEQHQSIQAAIDVARPGDAIEVKPATYRERIVLKPGVTVRSVGEEGKGELGLRRAEVTIIDGGGNGSDFPGVTMADGATLDGFTVTNVGGYDDEKWQEHWDGKGEDQPHDRIGQFGVPGIVITGVTCKVMNNIVHHIGDTGIVIRGEEGKSCAPLVSANICYRNMGGGIGSMAGSTAVIDGNICFENFYAGIGQDGADPLVTGNVCYSNVRAGIGVSNGASPVVRKNRCFGNRRAGIGIRTSAATRPVIEDNDCYENEMAGIGTEDEAAPIVFGNRCYRNKLAGIGCRARSSALIRDNHCYENSAAGIGVASADPLILRNRLEKNQTAGIGISGDSKARVIDNTCIENRLVAVGIPDGSSAILQRNTLVRTGGMPPIVAILGGSEAVLVGNTITGGGVAGILLEGQLDAIGNLIEGQNGGAGILVRESSKVTLTENNISGYRISVNDQRVESGSVAEQREFKVIGYLPSWSGNSDKLQYDKLTHINYSFIVPNPDGSLRDLPRPEMLKDLVDRAHANNVKVGIAIGGWNGGDDSTFETLAAVPESRSRFVSETMNLVRTYELDGVDMDWEYPDAGDSGGHFLTLMRELSVGLHHKGKFLSAAVVSLGRTGKGIRKEVFPLIDMLNIMAYDGRDHSLYSQAEASIQYWSDRGCPKDKIILGLPFYGRSPYRAYRDLVRDDPTAPGKDALGEIRYNGIATMQKKTRLAMEKGGGIMIWELSQDVEGNDSLLKAVTEVIRAKALPQSPE